VIRGREEIFILVRDDHGLQHVDHLRDIRHAHPVRVGMENIEVQGGDERIAQAVLLEQEARVGARLHVVPGAPFIDVQARLFRGIVLVDGGEIVLDQAIDAQGAAQGGNPLVFAKARGGALLFPHARRHRVVVETDGVHHVRLDFAAQGIGPADVVVIAAAGDEFRPRAFRRLHEGVVVLVQVRVVLRAHIAAAAPGFVADAKVIDFIRLGAAILAAQLGQGRLAVRGHVFQPFGHFLRRAGTEVAIDVGLCAQQLGQVEEFVRADGIRLFHAAPVGVDLGRALVARADAILPVVFIGEAAARPAYEGHVQLFQRAQHVVAPALGVRNRRIRAHPHAFVDARAQVLGELAVHVLVDHGTGLGHVDGDIHGGGEGAADGQAQGQDAGVDEFHAVSCCFN